MVLFPGRRQRKRNETACNIEEREERKWRRRLKFQRPLKKTGIGWRGLPRYRSSWEGMRGLDENQVLRRWGMLKWKHIKREVGFQSSRKMMSISQIITFHNKPVKTAEKKETVVDVGLVVCFVSSSCSCICCVLCEHSSYSNPHLLQWSSVQSSPRRGSRGLLVMRQPW